MAKRGAEHGNGMSPDGKHAAIESSSLNSMDDEVPGQQQQHQDQHLAGILSQMNEKLSTLGAITESMEEFKKTSKQQLDMIKCTQEKVDKVCDDLLTFKASTRSEMSEIRDDMAKFITMSEEKFKEYDKMNAKFDEAMAQAVSMCSIGSPVRSIASTLPSPREALQHNPKNRNGENIIKISGFEEGTPRDKIKEVLDAVLGGLDPDKKFSFQYVIRKCSDNALLKFDSVDRRRQYNTHFKEDIHGRTFNVKSVEYKLFVGPFLVGDAKTKNNATRVFFKTCEGFQTKGDGIPKEVNLDKQASSGEIYANGKKIAYITIENGMPKVTILSEKAAKLGVDLKAARDKFLENWH